MTEYPEPDWQVLVDSQLWQEVYLPYFDALISANHEALEKADFQQLRALQGALVALKTARDLPYERLEAQKVARLYGNKPPKPLSEETDGRRDSNWRGRITRRLADGFGRRRPGDAGSGS